MGREKEGRRGMKMPHSAQFTGEHIGLVYAKSMLKLLMIIFFAMESFRWHLLIPIGICFAAYFTMPMKYRTDQPYKSAEAWVRMGFGFVIALLLLVFLTPGAGINAIFGNLLVIILGIVFASMVGILNMGMKKPMLTLIIAIVLGGLLGTAFFGVIGSGLATPSVSIFFLALAFFVTLPERVAVENGPRISIGIAIQDSVSKLYSKDEKGNEKWKLIGDGYFLGLVLMAGMPIVFSWVGGKMTVIFFIVWFMSLFIGYTGGREGRPAIGMIMIFFAIMAFSYQFTGTIGVSVFGQYWPMVYNTGSMIIDPLTTAANGAATSVSDAYLAVSCPSCYQAEMERRQQLAAGIKSGGTTKALELTGFEALNYLTQEPKLDPTIPLVGYIELQNSGEFTANNVIVKLGEKGSGVPVLQDPTAVSAADPHRGETGLGNDKCIFTECTGTTVTGGSSCSWSTQSRPEDVKIMNFKCGKPIAYSSWSSDLKTCECRDTETGTFVADASNCNAGSGCNDKTKISIEEGLKKYDCGNTGGNCYITFKKAGWMVKIPFYYDFDYTVNGSLDVQVMNKDLFLRKLLNKELQSTWQTTGFISQYSGGPLKLSVYTQKQPLRDDETINCRIGIENTGEGTVKKDAIVRLRMPITSGITMVGEPASVSSVRFGETNTNCKWTTTSGYKEVQCKLSSNLKPGDTATYLFSYKFKLDPSIPVKDLLYIADAGYTYTTREDVQVALAEAPIQ